MLGDMYFNGIHVSAEIDSAIDYYTMAFANGNQFAAICLARCYLTQKPQNINMAKKYLKLILGSQEASDDMIDAVIDNWNE
jgi:TPR repeat protein